MNLSSQRQIAAKLLKCGVNRVFIDSSAPNVNTAITRRDIRNLITRGYVRKKPEVSTSRFRARELAKKKHHGQRKQEGSRKGTSNARVSEKTTWIMKVRALRRYLLGLKKKGALNAEVYRKMYRMSSGGYFRDRGHLRIHLEKMGVKV